jgi:hypothetical protein
MLRLLEKLYIQYHLQKGLLINEQYTCDRNPLFLIAQYTR